jgi:hypothetical protein
MLDANSPLVSLAPPGRVKGQCGHGSLAGIGFQGIPAFSGLKTSPDIVKFRNVTFICPHISIYHIQGLKMRVRFILRNVILLSLSFDR